MISENKNLKRFYLGEDVDLTCDVDSNPLSTLSWHNHTGVIDEIFGAKRIDLHLRNVSIDHSQTYSCKAHNGIGGIVTRNISLIVKDPSERPVTEAIKPSAESNISSVVGPVIGCLFFAILIAVIVALIIRMKRQNEPLKKRNIHEIKIEERKPSLHPTGNDTEMQAGYESLAGQDTTTEIEIYTDLDTEMQGGYESLAGQGTTTEIEMYTNLDDDMQARYESLAGQDTTTEKGMYTNLDTEMHPGMSHWQVRALLRKQKCIQI
ncbi:uncharacterized protein LOC132727770 [Ruditapes philippinarum]|uniref:uncharacterized protein LOC132727770 n=1 Tax=Ruditapes philippinarum TaxID=129788 RepID=UPI00295A5A0A|nr:uncharacterized protein LOC132727770 [Ruditapes philippinarum]XP_060569331.1 uncharacterized protein LOC132727770 [Ruditapes philippinarum]XP_060569333.1 uncharacterized protein LOC132727770 [Ruditapes philippinarum]